MPDCLEICSIFVLHVIEKGWEVEMKYSEEQLARFSTPPSQTERDKMDNAEKAIRNAIAASEELKSRSIKVFAQGSYRNRVNVRAESDVDIAIVCSDTFFWQGPDGATFESLGITPATYQFETFRKEVGDALIDHFGADAVTPGDKAFDVHANTYRVEADVAPFFDHRRYNKNGTVFHGVEMRSRTGQQRIINWPDQHYENGVAKNGRTGRSYKGCVRILKSVKNAMADAGIASAKAVPSFLMECLIWNVADNVLNQNTWQSAMRDSLAHLFNNTMTDEKCGEWGEVSELKYLFRANQPWNRSGAHKFVSDCWDFMGYE